MNIPWVEKYRPINLEDLISHNGIKSMLSKFVESDSMPHLLFYGPPGTGKTSTILSVARKMYKTNYKNMVLELNASDDRNIKVVRETIREFAGTNGDNLIKNDISKSSIKLVILDEADSMTQDAQFCLRRIMETYSAKTRFCLICNYINKIIPALQSRCCCLRFFPLSEKDTGVFLKDVCKKEDLYYENDAFPFLYKISNGDLRKALNILQGTYFNYSEITLQNIQLNTGFPKKVDLEAIISSLFNSSIMTSYEKINCIKQQWGLSVNNIITEITLYLRKIDIDDETLSTIYSQLSDLEANYTCTFKEDMCILGIISIISGSMLYSKGF